MPETVIFGGAAYKLRARLPLRETQDIDQSLLDVLAVTNRLSAPIVAALPHLAGMPQVDVAAALDALTEEQSRAVLVAMKPTDADLELLWRVIAIGLRRDHPELADVSVWDMPATPHEIVRAATQVIAASHLTRPMSEVDPGEGRAAGQ